MPVSETSKRSRRSLPGPSKSATLTLTSPSEVNFTALDTRLVRTWRTRLPSPCRTGATSSSTDTSSARPRSAALMPTMSITSSSAACTEKSSLTISSLPASILEKSRMLLMTRIRASAEVIATCAYSDCSALSCVSSSSSAMLTTPLRGVRISWLMLATNSDFSRDASSAFSRLARSSSSIRLRSETSRHTENVPVIDRSSDR